MKELDKLQLAVESLSEPESDVDDRTRAELYRLLRQQQSLIDALFGESFCAVLLADEEGNCVDANPAAAELFGIEIEEILERRVGDFVEGQFDFEQRWLELHQRGVDRGEVVVVRPDGSHRHVEYVGRANVLPDRHMAVLRDITERRQIEGKLHEASDRFEAILSATPAGIVVFDREYHIEMWNQGAENIYGWRAADVLDERAPFAEVFEAFAPEDTFTAVPVEIPHRTGNPIDISLSFAPLRGEHGELVGGVSIHLDISERRELETRVHQSNKMEAIGQLAGGVAHDFNNMLSAIKGFASILEYEMSEEDLLLEDVRQITKAADKATLLTRQLLAFSRKAVLRPEVIDVHDAIEDLQRILERLLGENIVFMVDSTPSTAHAYVDPGQLEQVLLNLAVNARDAMSGGGNLTIRTRAKELDGSRAPHLEELGDRAVAIEVRDDGHGMDEQTQARVFEPFFTTKESGSGTGLGLSTAYGIIKQSGGHIEVDSEVGRGTTFTIYLPYAESSSELSEVEEEERSLPRGEGRCILVVEDEEVVRRLATKLLQRHGFEVLVANNGGEALLMCEQREAPIDLLLSDVIMPHISGIDLAERLQSLHPEMETLYMTGYGEAELNAQGVDPSTIVCIEKPFDTRKFLEAVDKALTARRTSAAPGA